MAFQNIDVILENQSLKTEFKIRNLDLSQVWAESPDDPELENRQLHALLDWVIKYRECGSREKMEAQGYLFPPISFDIDPDSDWLRFELWLQGKPTRKKVKDQLKHQYVAKNPADLSEDELMAELEKLVDLLAEIHFSVDYKDDVPDRLAYENLLGVLKEEFDLLDEGWWHVDGCSGYCPDCFQRPWCDFGIQSCWPEDEELGKMFLKIGRAHV